MFNPFKHPLPSSVRSSSSPAEAGHPAEGWQVPADVTLDSPTRPDLTDVGVRNGVNLDQEDNPGYAGISGVHVAEHPGLAPDATSVKNDLVYQRYDGAVPGSSRLAGGVGPVTGTGTEWAGAVTKLHTPNPAPYGPVTGGADYASSVNAAHWAEQAQAISQAQAAASLVAAL